MKVYSTQLKSVGVLVWYYLVYLRQIPEYNMAITFPEDHTTSSEDYNQKITTNVGL